MVSSTSRAFSSRKLPSSALLRFVASRLLQIPLVGAGLVLATFLIVRLTPGDPATAVLGDAANPEAVAKLREELGLNNPGWVQLRDYVVNILHGSLGDSFSTGVPVAEVIQNRGANSALLASTALLVVMLVGMTSGVCVAVATQGGRHARVGRAFTSITSMAHAIPGYLVGTLLALVFGVMLGILPVAAELGWRGLILPTAALALRPSALLARIVRTEMSNVLTQDYIRTARSKRLPPRIVYLRHALRNALTGSLAISGIMFADLIGGAVIIESVFAIPGLGTALIDAVESRDYPVIQGLVLVLGIAVIIINLIVDILNSLFDPSSMTGRDLS